MEEGSTIDGLADLYESATLSTSDRGIAQAGLMFYPQNQEKNTETCFRAFLIHHFIWYKYWNTYWVGKATKKIFSGPVHGLNTEAVPELEKTVGMFTLYLYAVIFHDIKL